MIMRTPNVHWIASAGLRREGEQYLFESASKADLFSIESLYHR
jgi:hypothetical protein